MNRQQLAQSIADRVGLTKKQIEDVLEIMTEVITRALVNGEEVTLTGFGEFSARTRKGRVGVNPQKPSEAIDIPSVKVPKFKAGSRLKKSVKTGVVEMTPFVVNNTQEPMTTHSQTLPHNGTLPPVVSAPSPSPTPPPTTTTPPASMAM